ncbi:MAG: VanZ family protein [Clostridia bacterium]|nr:VanZ family protein [Clostridia bacterium]
MKKETLKKIAAWLPAVAVMVIIFCFSAQGADESAQVSGGLLDWLEKVFHITLNQNFIRKTAHALEFCALGVAAEIGFFVSLGRIAPVATLIFSFLYSLSDEIHQIFVPGRACMAKDIFIDLCGAAVGTLFFILIAAIIGKIKELTGRHTKGDES